MDSLTHSAKINEKFKKKIDMDLELGRSSIRDKKIQDDIFPRKKLICYCCIAWSIC